MMQKKQQQLLIHRANNLHARSSTVSSSIVLEKTEEYAEKIEDVLEPYYRQVCGKFAQMSGFSASAGEEEQEALKKNDIVICTALIPGKPAPRIFNDPSLDAPSSCAYATPVDPITEITAAAKSNKTIVFIVNWTR